MMEVPCETCFALTSLVVTRRCPRCLEVETRLAGYLREGGISALKFVTKTLDEVTKELEARRRKG